MAGNLVKEVMLKITGNDGDTEAKLDAISRKADELAAKHPDLKVKVDTGAAAAKLAVLKKELASTDKEADKTSFSFSKLGATIAELAGGVGFGQSIAEMSMFQKIMLGLNIATGLGEPLIAGLTVAVGGLAAGLASAGAGLGVFGIVAKGVWSSVSTNIKAAYAAQLKIANGDTGKKLIADNKALAASVKGLNDGQKQLVFGATNAELEWHRFTSRAAGGVASVLVPALGLVPKALSLMKPFLAPVENALKMIVSEVSSGLNSKGFASFLTMLKNEAPTMIVGLAHAIGNVIKGIGGIIKAFMPMSDRVFGGLDKITGEFAKWGQTLSGHSGFKDLMHMFQSETPLAVGALKNLAGIIKTVVSTMTGMSTFGNSKMLLQLALPFLKMANALLKAHPELVWLVLYLKLAADGGKKLHNAVTGVSDALGTLKKGKQLLTDFSAGFGDADKAAEDASGAAGTMGGKFKSALSSIGGWAKAAAVKMGLMTAATEEQTAATEEETGAQTELDGAMDANPIGLIVLAIAGLVVAFVELWKHCAAFRDFWKDVWHGIQVAFSAVFNFIKSHWEMILAILLGPIAVAALEIRNHWKAIEHAAEDLWHFITRIFGDIGKGIKAAWDGVKKATQVVWDWLKSFVAREIQGVKNILNWFAQLAGLFRGWWDDAVRAVEHAAGDMISFVKGLPHKIWTALGDLGTLLINAGKALIDGLIHGIESAVGGLMSTVKGLAGDVEGAFKSVLGIFSPSRVFHKHGQMIAQGLIDGMDSMRGPAAAAAARLASAVTPGGGISLAGGGGSSRGPGVLQLEVTGSRGTGLDAMFFEWLKNSIRARGGGGPDSVQRALGQL